MKEIEDIKKDYENVLNQLSDPELISDWKRFEELSKKKKELEKMIEKKKELEGVQKQIEENLVIAKEEDEELLALAEGEISGLREKEIKLKKELEDLLKEKVSPSNFNSVIIEVRAGTGGNEAALFATDLFRMYSRYASSKGWDQKILDSNSTELGGYKEITFEISGENVFSAMKHEGGVHRVQRIPETEKSGRIHTSTATVAVLPKVKKTERKIKSDELRVDFYRSSGAGGQNVNKRETAVRITHIPTGIVVASQNERNQLRNKENDLSILEARVAEKEREIAQSKMGSKRNDQIGTAKRVEKIRTYNFPQDRLTDHRIKHSWHSLEKIMEGELDPVVKKMKNQED